MSRILIDEDRKGVVLKEKEIELLKLIYRHRLLTTNQISMWLGVKKGTGAYHSLTRRLRKFVKYQLIVRHEYELGIKGFRYYYYRLGRQGFKLLEENGDISYSEADELELLRKTSYLRNLDHYLATQEVVINSLSQLDSDDIVSLHPQDHLLLPDEFSDSPLIIPDWILKCQGKDIYIELDTGSEGMAEINEKIQRYQTWSSMNPKEQHFVVFVCLDDSFQTKKKYGDKIKRLGNMKRSSLEVFKEEEGMDNLEIFFFPLRTAASSIVKILGGNVPISNEQRALEVEVGMRLFSEMNNEFPYKLKEVPLEEIYFEGVKEHHKVEKVYNLLNESGTYIETLGMVYLHEGHLLSLEKLDASYHLIQQQKTKRRIDRLIAVYENAQELESDILGTVYKNLLLGDTTSWEGNLFSKPPFYKQVSLYKLEVTSYE